MSAKSNPIDPVLLPALARVKYPGFGTDIVAMDLVKAARLEGAKAVVELRPLSAPPQVAQELENQIAQQVVQVPGVAELELQAPAPKAAGQKKSKPSPRPVAGVSYLVAVASGKGGVGKSTVAVNLALALKDLGLKVGLLDLDLYGPSLPTMLGISQEKPTAAPDGYLAPIEVHGIKALSIGLLLGSERALIWRGPLVIKAVRQLLHEVAWQPLDVLILDLPPGTGDIHISLVQEAALSGAVVVTTPQDVALADAIKGVDLFRTTDTRVLGIVENMSYFMCPDCESRHYIFGHGTVEPLCARLGVPFLGEIPLDPQVREHCDQGQPLMACLVESQAHRAYQELASKVKDALAAAPAAKEAAS